MKERIYNWVEKQINDESLCEERITNIEWIKEYFKDKVSEETKYNPEFKNNPLVQQFLEDIEGINDYNQWWEMNYLNWSLEEIME